MTAARVSQLVTEVLTSYPSGPVRASQVVVEALIAPRKDARVSQVVVEVLGKSTDVRASQQVVEALLAFQPGPVRVSQVIAEILMTLPRVQVERAYGASVPGPVRAAGSVPSNE